MREQERERERGRGRKKWRFGLLFSWKHTYWEITINTFHLNYFPLNLKALGKFHFYTRAQHEKYTLEAWWSTSLLWLVNYWFCAVVACLIQLPSNPYRPGLILSRPHGRRGWNLHSAPFNFDSSSLHYLELKGHDGFEMSWRDLSPEIGFGWSLPSLTEKIVLICVDGQQVR